MSLRIKRVFCSTWMELLVRWTLGGIFVYASIHKIVYPAYFAKIIYGYYLFPENLINVMAICLPYLEFFSGMALILGVYPRSAGLILSVMLGGFIIALAINTIRGHEFDCGCFQFGDAGHQTSTRLSLLIDSIYVLCGLYIIFYSPTRKWCLRQTGSITKSLWARS